MKKIISLLSVFITLNAISQNLNLVNNFAQEGIKTITNDGVGLDLINFIDYDQNSLLVYSKIFSENGTEENVIYKINTDGTFDTNFGENGKLSLPKHDGRFFVYKQNTGDLIIFFTRVLPFNTGTPNNERVITKYNANGELDNAFGVNGEVKIPIGNTDGTGVSNIIVLNDNTILFSDSEKFIKYNSNGSLDLNYGDNGIIQEPSIGHMTNSNDGNILFYNSTQLEKKDYNNNAISNFGDSGVYAFPSQNDYLVKAYPDRVSYMNLGELPVKFYDLNVNGKQNTNFNSTGIIDLETDNDTVAYFESFDFTGNKFYFLGISTNETPVIVCYDTAGNLFKLNNQNSYKESNLVTSGFTSAIEKDGFLFTCGYQYDELNDSENLIIAKYSTSNPATLSAPKFQNDAIKAILSKKFIEFKGLDKIKKIELFDLSGKRVRQIHDSNKVSILNLNKGLYIAHIKTNNKHTKVIKVLIK